MTTLAIIGLSIFTVWFGAITILVMANIIADGLSLAHLTVLYICFVITLIAGIATFKMARIAIIGG